MEEPEDLSDREPISCELVRAVLVVTELGNVSLGCSDWEFVEPQFFSFSKRVHIVVQIRRKRFGTKAHQ